MAKRHLPVRPDLDQLRHQAKDLLREIRRGDPAALADPAENHPEQVDPGSAKLADAQLALARSYGVPSWPRLVLACEVNVDAKAAVDADGFGGHTALFSTVVSQANFWPNHFGTPHDPAFTRLFLDRGADPNARASLRKRLNSSYDDHAMHEYRDVTPLSWGERFHFRKMVSVPAMRLIAERMGLRT